MNIAYFTNLYRPNPYGSVRSIISFKTNLEKAGHKVSVFAPSFRGFSDYEDGIFRYPSITTGYKIKNAIPIPFGPSIDRMFMSGAFDLVHVHQPFSLGKKGLLLARRAGIPAVFTYHCKYEEYTHYIPCIPDSVLKKYVIAASKRFADACDLVIAPGSEIKEMLVNRGVKSEIQVLPTGIDTGRFINSGRGAFRKKYGISDSDMMILWAGRMEKEKNLELALAALKIVMNKNPNIKALMAGDGSEKTRIENFVRKHKIQNRVILPGLIPHGVMPECYAAADMLIHTSMSETQGLIILEAFAAGLPVAAVRATGTNDIVKHDFSGLLTPPDVESFTDAITRLAENGKLRKRLGGNALKTSANYSESLLASKLISLYKELIKEIKK